ncbi:protein of unknown function [Alkalispirochaeta americana]|uniref:eCIS core domain-containing protein n=1 Tax=Alkalispirochaeta americana TaxID=159291 RepID=A0A1N6YAY5_9SPIO|nr:DUF4157 domain-containing protein [Alkalispirochaeta americana]SIR11734.1 protein of unknown function [Alkalispirochaeta americana]
MPVALHKFQCLLSEAIAAYRENRDGIAGCGIERDSTKYPVIAFQDEDRVFPLETGIKEEYERRFDYDLSKVRIHTGKNADSLARSSGAAAVTLGHDIYFAHGEFRPYTAEGMKLLAHEIQHTIQHDRGERMLYREEIIELEIEAEVIASRIMDEQSRNEIKGRQIPSDPRPENAGRRTEDGEDGLPGVPMSAFRAVHGGKPLIRYIGACGEEMVLTQRQYQEGVDQAVKRVQKKLAELGEIMTEENSNRSMLRVFESLSRRV